MAKSNTGDLTDRQKFFCLEYLKDLNGTQAAIRAGYSAKTANEQSARLLANVSIQEFTKGLMEERANRCEVDADKVLKELSKIAFSDLRKFYGPDGQLLPIGQIDDESAGAISSLKSYEEKLQATDDDGEQIVQGTNKEIRMHDKLKALEMLGKHFGVFEKDNGQKSMLVIPQLSPEQIKALNAKIERKY
jgi:phage terminase small subunit